MSLIQASTNYQLANTQDVANIEQDLSRSPLKPVAQGLLKYYNGTQPGQPIGVFEEPSICWWEVGAVWGGLIDYWNYTADTQYNGLVQQALTCASWTGQRLYGSQPDHNRGK